MESPAPPAPPTRRRRWRTLLAAALAVALLVVCVALVVLQLGGLDPWATRTLRSVLQERVQGRVDLEAVEVRALGWHLRIRGLEAGDAPFGRVEVPRARARLAVLPLLVGKLHIRDLEVEAPVLELARLPSGTQASAGDDTPHDALTVRRFRLRDGTVRIHEADEAGAEVSGLQVDSDELWVDGIATADLRAESMRLSRGAARFAAQMEGLLRLRSGTLRTEEILVTHPSLDARLEGRMDWKPAPPRGEARAFLRAAVEQVFPFVPGLPDWFGEVSGEARIAARLRYDVNGGEARLDIETGPLSLGEESLRIRSAEVLLASGGVRIPQYDLLIFGAEAGGHAEIRRRNGEWRIRARTAWTGLETARLQRAGILPATSVRVASRVDGEVEIELPFADPWGAHAECEIRLHSAGEAPEAGGVPLGGLVRATLDDGKLELLETDLHAPGGHLRTCGGSLNRQREIDLCLRARVTDAGRLLSFLEEFPELPESRFVQPPKSLWLEGRLEGPLHEARWTGRAEAKHLQIAGLSADARLEGALSLAGAEVREAELSGPHLRLQGAGNWSRSSGGTATDFRWELERLDLEAAARNLELPTGAKGVLRGEGHVRSDAGGITAEGRIGVPELVVPGVPPSSLTGTFRMDPAGVTLESLRVKAEERELLVASGTLPWAGVSGELRFAATDLPIALVPQAAPLGGTLTASGVLSGAVTDLRLRDPAEFRWEGLSLGPVGEAGLAGVVAMEDGAVRVTLDESGSLLRGELRVDPATPWNVTADLRVAPRTWTLWTSSEGDRVVADYEQAGLRLGGPLGDPRELAGEMRVEGLVLRHGERRIEAVEPLRITLTDGGFELRPWRLRAAAAPLTISGVWSAFDGSEWRVALLGETRLETLPPVIPDARVAGDARLDLAIEGVRERATGVNGTLEVTDGTLRWDALPQAIRQIDTRIVHAGRRLRIESLTAELGGGELRGTGFLELEGLTPQTWMLGLEGQNVRLRVPEGLRTLSDFELSAAGDAASGRVTGEVRIERGRYTEPVNLQRALTAPPAYSGPGAESFLDAVRMDVRVVSEEDLWLDNNLATVEVRGDLQVRGTASRPWLVGSMESVAPGRIGFNRVRYALESAHLEFSTAHPNDPELDLVGTTTVADWDVQIHVGGRASRPEVTFRSVPELPSHQIVALLATGGAWRPDGEMQASNWAVAQYAAGYTAPLEGMLSRRTGLDIVRISPALNEGEGDPTARVTIGEHLTSRATVTYSSTLQEAQGSSVELSYRLTDHLSVRGARQDDGSNLVEAQYGKSFGGGKSALAGRASRSRALLTDVTFTGLPEGLSEEEARDALDVPAGSRIDRFQWVTAQERVARALIEGGYPLSRVRCSPPHPGPEGNGEWRPRCEVRPGPRVQVSIHGLSKKKTVSRVRRAVLERWEDLATAAARDWFLDRGHAWAEATGTLERPEADRWHVELSVSPGPRVRVVEVEIEGLETVPEDRVRDVLESATRGLLSRGPRLTPELLEQDVLRVQGHLIEAGYLDAVVDEPRVERVTDDRARIVLPVREGPRFRLEEVRVSGASALDTGTVTALAGLAPGEPLAPRRIEDAARAVEAEYDRLGYPDATVLWSIVRLPTPEAGGSPGVGAALEVDEGSFVRVGSIRIENTTRVRDRVVLRELDLSPDSPFSRAALLEAADRLRGLGLFRRVSVRGEVTGDVSVRDVVVVLEERPQWDLRTGVGLEDEEGVRLSAALESPGVLGRNLSAGVQARWSQLEWSGRLLLGTRRVGGRDLGLLTSLALERENRPGFGEERLSFNSRLSHPLGPRQSVWLRYRLDDVRYVEVDVPPSELDDEEGAIAGVSVGWHHDRRDDLINPGTGTLFTLEAGPYHGIFGSDFDFARAIARGTVYRPLTDGGLSFAVSARLGAAWPYGGTTAVPRSEWFFAGGGSSMRGYRKDRLGPVDPITGERGGGEALLVVNNELKVPLSQRFEAFAFLDAGNVWRDLGDMDPTDLKLSLGPGLEFDTPAGPLRVMLGWKLDRESDEDPRRFHFTFGPSF